MTTSKPRTLREIDPGALESVCGGWIDGSWFSGHEFTQERTNKFLGNDWDPSWGGSGRSDGAPSGGRGGYGGGHNSR
jgi:hypothetical protein